MSPNPCNYSINYSPFPCLIEFFIFLWLTLYNRRKKHVEVNDSITVELRKPSRHYFLASDNTLQIHFNSCDSKRRDSEETLGMWYHHYKLLKTNFLHWIWNLFMSLGRGSCLKRKYAVSVRISVRINTQIIK